MSHRTHRSGEFHERPHSDLLDFDGDGRDDILVRGRRGIGILSLRGRTLASLLVRSHGSWFGVWRFDAPAPPLFS